MARPIDPRKSAAWQRRLQQFAAGGVMEIPEDRVDLVRIAIATLAGEPEPC